MPDGLINVPWDDYPSFHRVGYDSVVALHGLMKPVTPEATVLSADVIRHIYDIRRLWEKYEQAPIADQAQKRHAIIEQCLGFTPWSEPSIKDLVTVVEFLIRDYATAPLRWHLMEDGVVPREVYGG